MSNDGPGINDRPVSNEESGDNSKLASPREEVSAIHEGTSHAPHEDHGAQERLPIYFNFDRLPQPRATYVAWVDVMGAGNMMSQSLLKSANCIGRLHIALIMALNRDLAVSPFMDGAYVRAERQEVMLDVLCRVFEEMAFYFLKAKEHKRRFLIRAGLAFGEVIEGVSIPTSTSKILGAYNKTWYREGIYFGHPIQQANRAEKSAPPFGIAIDESARGFCQSDERPLSGLWWRWDKRQEPPYMGEFKTTLVGYLEWCRKHALSTDYKDDRIETHRRMAEEYFAPD